MKLIVFSDSHNSGGHRMLKALESEKDFGTVIFLGDGDRDADELENRLGKTPFYRVSGNSDYLSHYPEQALLPMSGLLLFCTHGHRQHVKTGLGRLCLECGQAGADIALFGHTHIPCNSSFEGMRLFNPGSIAYPRSGGPSYGRIILPGGQHGGEGQALFEIVEYADK